MSHFEGDPFPCEEVKVKGVGSEFSSELGFEFFSGSSADISMDVISYSYKAFILHGAAI
jgi:hypothetical protein